MDRRSFLMRSVAAPVVGPELVKRLLADEHPVNNPDENPEIYALSQKPDNDNTTFAAVGTGNFFVANIYCILQLWWNSECAGLCWALRDDTTLVHTPVVKGTHFLWYPPTPMYFMRNETLFIEAPRGVQTAVTYCI